MYSWYTRQDKKTNDDDDEYDGGGCDKNEKRKVVSLFLSPDDNTHTHTHTHKLEIILLLVIIYTFWDDVSSKHDIFTRIGNCNTLTNEQTNERTFYDDKQTSKLTNKFCLNWFGVLYNYQEHTHVTHTRFGFGDCIYHSERKLRVCF